MNNEKALETQIQERQNVHIMLTTWDVDCTQKLLTYSFTYSRTN